MKKNHKKGITILETLLVIAILGILATIVLPQFSKIKENQMLKNAEMDIITNINKARSQTLSSLDSSEYGVHFQSDKIIIFKGIIFDSENADNKEIEIILPAVITNVTLDNVSGTDGDIYFKKLTGVPNKTGTNAITVSTPNYSKIIIISPIGIVNSN